MKAALRLRFALFVSTGLAVPFYAFPPLHLAGKSVDLATLFAAAFVAASLPAVLRQRLWSGAAVLGLGAAVVPLLALLPPRPATFSVTAFGISYMHWLLVAAFFLAATTLPGRPHDRNRLIVPHVVMATLVACFAIYQTLGHFRGWPGTGLSLGPIQREIFQFMYLGSYLRPTSVFLEPSWLGGYLVWVLALAAVGLFSVSSARQRLLWGAPALLLLATIAATISLGSYADLSALLVAGGVVLVRSGRVRLNSLLAAAALTALLVTAAVLSPPGRPVRSVLVERYNNIRASRAALPAMNPELPESSWIRIQNARLLAELFQSNPLTGCGLGQFSAVFAARQVDPLAAKDPWCGWLAIGAEMGILGPLLLAGALVLVWRRSRASTADAFTALAVPALVVVAAVQQLHTASFIDLWWWFPLSLAAVLSAPPANAADLPGRGAAVSSPSHTK